MDYETIKSPEQETLKDINKNIFTELDCSKDYVMQALNHKSEDITMADKELAMSSEELGHAMIIKDKIEKRIEKFKQERNQYAEMIELSWYYTKHRVMAYVDWIKSLHEKYNK